jgi:hypothetical protein
MNKLPAAASLSKYPADRTAEDEAVLALQVLAGLLAATDSVAREFFERFYDMPGDSPDYWTLATHAEDNVRAVQWVARTAGSQLRSILRGGGPPPLTLGDRLRALADLVDDLVSYADADGDPAPTATVGGDRP